MGYKETLSKMVEDSGLKLREIVEKCKEYHVNIDPSYISKLQKTDQAPAKEDVNIAIAKACNGDPDLLVFEAHMDRAPNVVSESIKALTEGIKDFVKLNLPNASKDVADLYEKQIDSMSAWEVIRSVKDNGLGMGLFEVTETKKKYTYYSNQTPEGEEREMVIPEYFRLTMPDDSMEPLIPQGALLTPDSKESINNGDICYVEVPDGRRIIRKYGALKGEVMLVPFNGSYPIETYKTKTLKILGRIKEAITRL